MVAAAKKAMRPSEEGEEEFIEEKEEEEEGTALKVEGVREREKREHCNYGTKVEEGALH